MRFPPNFSSKSRRWLVTAAAAVAGTAGAGYALRRFVQRALPPQHGHIVLNGLEAPVEIIRDAWGAPHIYAQCEHDLFFAQGFVHAQDRLFQMEINRRLGMGRVSEMIGASALASDRFARYMGWPRVAESQVAGMDAVVADVTAAYAAGVNAFIQKGRLPVEFALLAHKPEPWQYLDSVAWGTVLAWGLSVNWEAELDRLLLVETLGPEKAADMTPGYNGRYPTILPAEEIGARMAAAMIQAFREAAAQLPFNYAPTGKGVGSNNWVVSAAHTETGRPILANDPHLPPVFPAFWYENHLVGGDYNVTGFTMPGVPGVIIGHNAQVAWGLTNAFPDVQDIFVERFDPDDAARYEVDGAWRTAEIVEEVIAVRGRKPVVERVRYTRHGPVFSDMLPDAGLDMALCWASHNRTNHLRAILATNKAQDWDSFREGLRYWGFPSQNAIYADVAGNIAYMMPGMVPRRKKGDGMLPSPGWTSEYDWVDWIPFEELPQLVNPPEGMIVTANNRVHGSDYPYLLTSEWMPGYRAERIWQLLRQRAPLNLVDNGRIQFDVVSLLARRFMASALPLIAQEKLSNALLAQWIQKLQAWNGDMQPNQVEPTLYFGWLVHFTHSILVQAVGIELTEKLLPRKTDLDFCNYPFHEAATELTLNWLEDGAPDWVGDIRPLLLPALQDTLQVLQAEYGSNAADWRWGRLHFIELNHPMVRIPVLGRFWKPQTLAVGGDGYTINQADVTPHFPPDPVNIVASCRFVLDVGAWDNCLAALPGGQSGQPASAHFLDGLAEWVDGRYHPMLFSRSKIETAAAGWLILAPAQSGAESPNLEEKIPEKGNNQHDNFEK